MGCAKFIDHASGTAGFVCGPGFRSQRCEAYDYIGEPPNRIPERCIVIVERLCDWPIGPTGKKTCDMRLCVDHAKRVGNLDFCPSHLREWTEKWGSGD